MAIKHIIASGIGFSPGSVEYIVTHGFGSGESTTVTLMPVLLWKAEGECMHWSTISGRIHWSR